MASVAPGFDGLALVLEGTVRVPQPLRDREHGARQRLERFLRLIHQLFRSFVQVAQIALGRNGFGAVGPDELFFDRFGHGDDDAIALPVFPQIGKLAGKLVRNESLGRVNPGFRSCDLLHILADARVRDVTRPVRGQ